MQSRSNYYLMLVLAAACPWVAAEEPRRTSSSADKPFVHPGLLHTDADFDRMKSKVDAGEQPWLAGWQALEASRHAQLDWQPRPLKRVVRGGDGQNFPTLFNDVHAAYQLALRWKISRDDRYAERSIGILNAWSAKLQEITGNSDRCLAAGIYGYQMANAGEIMRTYPGWKPKDFARFQQMMLDVFSTMNRQFLVEHNNAAITNYWANWDLCNMASLMAIGVLCDRRDLYDEAIHYCYHGRGNGALDKAVYYVHPGNLGQWQEAGRDQGHTTLGVALLGPICEMAWHQGDDLYSFDNNRFLAGAEYVAKYNLEHAVPYEHYAWGLGQRGDYREQPVISSNGRGGLRNGFELVVNHYTKRKGIAAPYSEQYAVKLRPERGGGGHASSFDQLGLGTLTATLDPQVESPSPTGLVARRSASGVELSWWGAVGASTYEVGRGSSPEGPFTTIASGLEDPLTFTDANPKARTNYYVVTAIHDAQRTTRSNVAQVCKDPVLRAQLSFNDPQASGELRGGARIQQGPDGTAVTLDGDDGHVVLPAGVVSGLSDFTIAMSVRVDEHRTWARLFDFGDDRGHYLYLAPKAANGKVRFALATVYRYNEQAIEGTAALPVEEWVHVAVTLAGTTGTLYLNGEVVGVNPSITLAPFRLGHTPNNWLGRSQYASDPYLKGAIADVRIYDGALSADEIGQLASAARP